MPSEEVRKEAAKSLFGKVYQLPEGKSVLFGASPLKTPGTLPAKFNAKLLNFHPGYLHLQGHGDVELLKLRRNLKLSLHLSGKSKLTSMMDFFVEKGEGPFLRRATGKETFEHSQADPHELAALVDEFADEFPFSVQSRNPHHFNIQLPEVSRAIKSQLTKLLVGSLSKFSGPMQTKLRPVVNNEGDLGAILDLTLYHPNHIERQQHFVSFTHGANNPMSSLRSAAQNLWTNAGNEILRERLEKEKMPKTAIRFKAFFHGAESLPNPPRPTRQQLADGLTQLKTQLAAAHRELSASKTVGEQRRERIDQLANELGHSKILHQADLSRLGELLDGLHSVVTVHGFFDKGLRIKSATSLIEQAMRELNTLKEKSTATKS